MNALTTNNEPAVHTPALEVSPAMVTINTDGAVWRDMHVRLPKGCIADDLKRPELWRLVQRNKAKALRRFDRLMITDYNESWIAECVVADASEAGAVLAKSRITTFPERYDRLFQDENYTVIWVGNGYRVQRKSDGALVTSVTHSKAVAERDLLNMTPRSL